MTTPSGRPGFNVVDRFALTGDDGSVPDLVNRTQEVITGILKERVRASQGWNQSTSDVWAQLRRGIPFDHALLEVIVNRLTGGLVQFPTKQDAIMALKKVPGTEDLVELLTGIEDGDENDLGTFFLNLRRFFESIDFTDPDFDPAAVQKAFVEIVIQPFIKTITKITAALLGPLSIGLLTDVKQTLLLEGGFDDPITIINNGDGISHDATDGVPGTTPLGCAKVLCDGTAKRRATSVIEVGPGWVLEAGMRTKYVGLVAGANALRLNILPYSNETTPIVGGEVMIATPGAVSGTSGGTNGWGSATPFSGSWTVPLTGVTHVALEWEVTESATAGTAKFDELYLQSTEKIPQAFTKDLPEDLQTLVNEALSLWQGLGERLHVDEWDDWLADTWTNAQTEANQIRDILAGFVVTPINAVVQAIKDLFTVTQNKTQHLTNGGTLPPTSVSGVGGAPNIGQALEDTWNKFWDGVHGLTGSTGKTADDVRSAASNVTGVATDAVNAAQTATALATYAGGRALWEAANPTIDATMLESSLGTGSTPTWFSVSQTASAMGFIRTRVAQDKSIVQWFGRGNAMTTAKLHTYRMDTATGDLTWVQTKDIVPASLPNASGFGRVIIQLDTAVHMEPGDVLAFELCVTGGTHDMAGLTVPWLTPDESALPKGAGATRNSGTETSAPATILDDDVPYGTKIPYMGAGMPQGELPPPAYTYYFTDTFSSLSAWSVVGGGDWSALSGSAINHSPTAGFLLYSNSTYSDKVRAIFASANTLGRNGSLAFSSNAYIRYFIHVNAACTNGVGIEMQSNGAVQPATVRLISLINGVRTVRDTSSTTRADGAIVNFTIEYDPATKTYTVTYPGGDPMSWTDSGDTVLHGSDYRRAAIFSDFDSMGINDPNTQVSGVASNFTIYDVA